VILSLPVALFWLGAAASGLSDVAVEAHYEAPAKPGAPATIVARLFPRSADLRVNELPAPRLRLEPQSVLIDRQPEASTHVPVVDPEFARYLDTAEPLRFAVASDARVPRGTYTVPASLTFAYCSRKQGWCRKGVERIELQVTIP
jgi:hypothetical protein